MLSNEGRTGLAQLLVASLENGSVEVSDGTQTARTPITGARADDAEAHFRVAFQEDEANFEWKRQSLLNPEGVVIDSDEQDLGRKAQGTVWGFTYIVDFAEAS